jgi:hypothetical protein
MKHYCVLVAITLLCGLSFGQVNELEPGTLTSIQQNYIVIDGTYQVILNDERMVEPELSDAILHEINNLRDDFKIKYMRLGDYTEILILPFSVINAEGFVPLEKYSYAQ